jgi:glycosyltransferase involved in cell wall biosynthesis
MVCELNKSEALKLKIAPADKMTTVYSGIDFSRIDRINRKISRKIIIERHNINPENQIVGVLARLFPQKAPDVFVNTAKEVLKKNKNVTFIFVGDGPLKEKTEKMICAMGLSENVILAGWQEDVNNYLGSFDVFLLTSLWEGLGRAITEAAYSGVPMVASRVNGVPEIVKKEETGFLFEPGDSVEASKFVLMLLEDSELRKKLGSMSRKKISEQFDIDVMIKKIESIYIEELKIPDFKMQADI